MENGSHIRLVLWKAYKAVESVDRMSIAATGLCLSDFAVLELLLHKGPQPVSVIGEKVLLTSGSITAAIDRLQRKGYVRRRRDPNDGRVFRVRLTVEGRKLIEKAYAEHAGNLDQVAGVLTPSERGELVRLAKKLGYHAEAFAEQFRC
jgi:MarR family 2-MHQ and catechol resistance regulon transcriptional repressor